MRKNRINYFVIIGLFVFGIGSYGFATTQSGNSGFDSIIPAVIGFFCIKAGIIYLIIYLLSNVYLKRELVKEEVNFGTNTIILNKKGRRKKLINLLSITLIALLINTIIILEYVNTIYFILLTMIVSLLIASYWGMVNKCKLGKYIWIAVLLLLTFISLSNIISQFFDNYLELVVLLIISTSYVYVINSLIRSKLINLVETFV